MSNPFDQFGSELQAALPGAPPPPANGFTPYQQPPAAAPAPPQENKPIMNTPMMSPPPAMNQSANGGYGAPTPPGGYGGYGQPPPQQGMYQQPPPPAIAGQPPAYGNYGGQPPAPAGPPDAGNPFAAPALPASAPAPTPFDATTALVPAAQQPDPWAAPVAPPPAMPPAIPSAPAAADPWAQQQPPAPQPIAAGAFGAPAPMPPSQPPPPAQPADPFGGGAPAPPTADPYAGAPPPQPAGDPFSVFSGAPAPPAPVSVAPSYDQSAAMAPPQAGAPPPGPPPQAGAIVPAGGDDNVWADMFGGPAPSAAASTGGDGAGAPTNSDGLFEQPVTSTEVGAVRKQDGELPPGGEWYDARIFTPTLGVMFFKPQELTDSLFLNTDRSLVDGLDERPVVAFIVEGSSARSAGVELGHVLLKVNGVDVKNPKEASRLIKEGPRPLPLLFYVPDTEVVVAEGEHMVKYDTRETTAPNSAKDWKPKYVVIGGIIAQPWMMNMYRSKSEYDIAVIETQARRPVSVKVKQFSLQGARVQNDWQGPQMVKYKNKLHPWKYIVVLPVARNPIKISSPNLSQLKPVHEGIRRVLTAQKRDRGHGGGGQPQNAPPPRQQSYNNGGDPYGGQRGGGGGGDPYAGQYANQYNSQRGGGGGYPGGR
mmetsp:Transcript_17501/g.24323  ORF Transcript_17501/g.24323 Transcript_17501/m.24323 type:complete len:649 (+) Transcript_17501:269-2215(+)